MITSTQTQAADVYTDLNGLNSITQLGKKDKDKALREVAEQFESMFVKMMMKSMRDANAVFSEDSMFNSRETEFYQQMYDDQLAMNMTNSSKHQGVGLADVIYRQLKQEYNKDIDPENREWQPIEARRLNWSHIAPNTNTEKTAADANDKENKKVEAVAPISSINGQKQKQYSSPEEFVKDIYPVAKKIAKDMNVNPLAIVAQAALETGWGKHMITDQSGNSSFNFFGIKADKRWSGDSVEVVTHEYHQNVMMKERAQFRSYPSMQAGLEDYAKFLQSPRYEQALKQGSDVDGYAKELQQAGYATDPFYAKKISRIANSDLMQHAINQVSEKEVPNA